MANMADYWLPIIIEKRRWHICHLKKSTEEQKEFSFIVDENSETLFEIPKYAKFISQSGSTDDKKVGSPLTPSICEEDGCFYIDFADKKTKYDKIRKALSIKEYSLTIDKNNKDASSLYKVAIRLNECYSYTFIIHRCNKRNDCYIGTVIDFGSEASQISCKKGINKEESLNIVSVLKNICDIYKDTNTFWQTDSNWQLFKSIFFVNVNSKFDFAEKPLAHANDSFIQILKERTAKGSDYENLFIAPNFKLMLEMHDRSEHRITLNTKAITGTNDSTNNESNFYNEENTKIFLRLILSQFLYVVIEKNKNISGGKYLNVTMLVPNVYSQKNIYELIEGLYEDFKTITAQKQYNTFKGIEIRTISESDAAFLGAKSFSSSPSYTSIPSAASEYFLIIDAGKGTTDFSILRQDDQNDKRFDCVFRSGVPIGGNFLTYAFFEGLQKYLSECGIKDIHSLLLESARTDILDFLSYLEKLKFTYKHDNASQSFEMTSALLCNIRTKIDEGQGIIGIIDLLKEINGLKIKEIEVSVTASIEKLTKSLEECINKSRIMKFNKIIFTGRAFLFEPLLTSVKNMFKQNYNSEDKDFIFNNNDTNEFLKKICVTGGFSVDKYRINGNSELCGYPSIISSDGSQIFKYIEMINNPKKKLLQKLLQWVKELLFAKYNGFLVEGLGIPKNCEISLNSKESNIPEYANNFKNPKLYFIGNGFIVQGGGENEICEISWKNSTSAFDDIKKSLFPFYDMNKNYAQKTSTERAKSEENIYIDDNILDKKMKLLENELKKDDDDEMHRKIVVELAKDSYSLPLESTPQQQEQVNSVGKTMKPRKKAVE